MTKCVFIDDAINLSELDNVIMLGFVSIIIKMNGQWQLKRKKANCPHLIGCVMWESISSRGKPGTQQGQHESSGVQKRKQEETLSQQTNLKI